MIKINGRNVIEVGMDSWDGKPRKMLAWNDESEKPVELMVYGYIPESKVWVTEGNHFTNFSTFRHIGYAESPVDGFSEAWKYVHIGDGNFTTTLIAPVSGTYYLCLLRGDVHSSKPMTVAKFVNDEGTVEGGYFSEAETRSVYWPRDIYRIIPVNFDKQLKKGSRYKCLLTGKTEIRIFDGMHFVDSANGTYGKSDLMFFDRIECLDDEERVTNEELTQWLASGKGVYRKQGCASEYPFFQHLTYVNRHQAVDEDIEVRRFPSDTFHAPTYKYMGIVK